MTTLLKEGLRFVTGKGRFVEDIWQPGMLYCVIVRSPISHACLKDVRPPKRGTNFYFFSGRDIPEPSNWQSVFIPNMKKVPYGYGVLANKKLRFVGEPVAVIVSDSLYTAYDLAEEVEIDFDPLPPITDYEKSISTKDILIYPEWGDNLMARFSFSNGDLNEAESVSDKVIERTIKMHRYSGTPLETRGILAYFDESQKKLKIYTSKQDPHVQKEFIANYLGLSEDKIQVICPDIGGGFGIKLNFYPEDVVIPYLALKLRKPIKWVETRREHLQASTHARELKHEIKVGFKKDGSITFINDYIVGDVGAYSLWPHSGLATVFVAGLMLESVYKVRALKVVADCVVTNKCPRGAYRGFGHPEATLAIESLMDIASRELGLTPIQIRGKNLITSFPYKNLAHQIHDSGDYYTILKKADEIYRKLMSLYGGGRHFIGVGLAFYPEVTTPALAGLPGWQAQEAVRLEIKSDGYVHLYSGTVSLGTGLETTLATLVAEELSIKPDQVIVHLGDSEESPYSLGSWGSRSLVTAGSAAVIAAKKLRSALLQTVASLFETKVEDLEIINGVIRVKDSSRGISFRELVTTIFKSPEMIRQIPDGLSTIAVYHPPLITKQQDSTGLSNVSGSMASAIHIAVVSLDAETGQLELLKYIIIHDCGRIINNDIVEGQVIGGTVQGIGGTLLEEFVYDNNGNLLNSTFADYLIPSAAELPVDGIDVIKYQGPPTPYTEIGAKGVGENGIIGPPAALVNAVNNILSRYGYEILETPLKPEKLSAYIYGGPQRRDIQASR
jgi:carbon-monoxide dehydrogenase large subunit